MDGCVQRWIRFLLIALIPWASSLGSYSDDAVAAGPGETAEPKNLTSAFMVGAARRDITPARPVPMWGYGGRHDQLSQGVIDRLEAKAVVIQAGPAKVAIVGMDLGRGPTPTMMAQIRQSVAAQGIGHVLVCGSHTHHGPVIELTAEEGFGKGKFDDAVAYARELPGLIVAAILEADKNRQPATMGIASRDVGLNRNRHSKRPDKPTDPRLVLIRFDHLDGSPIAFMVHYTAHPVLTSEKLLSFSADYPGYLKARVESALKAPCVFLQGAAGDQSASPPDGKRDPRAYGELLAEEALTLARAVNTSSPKGPSLAASIDRFSFNTRVNFKSSITFVLYARSFFPELVRNFFREFEGGMNPEVTTIVLNRELAIVGVPGEPFAQHALRLRQRSNLPWTLVFGYCNGHLLYFPTIEAASEGGYGADPRVSPVELGAGELMMNRALITIYRLVGKFPDEPSPSVPPR
jgi:neutral ceramidase